MLSPRLNDDLRVAESPKPLDAQAFVAELAVEGFVGAVLPRLASFDDGCLNMRIG
jgi:hypothetical protein